MGRETETWDRSKTIRLEYVKVVKLPSITRAVVADRYWLTLEKLPNGWVIGHYEKDADLCFHSGYGVARLSGWDLKIYTNTEPISVPHVPVERLNPRLIWIGKNEVYVFYRDGVPIGAGEMFRGEWAVCNGWYVWI